MTSCLYQAEMHVTPYLGRATSAQHFDWRTEGTLEHQTDMNAKVRMQPLSRCEVRQD